MDPADRGITGPILNLDNVEAIAREILRVVDGADYREVGGALSVCIAAIGLHLNLDRGQVLLATIRDIEIAWLKLAYAKEMDKQHAQETRRIEHRREDD